VATKQATIDFLFDQLRQLKGLRARKMFGEYAIYYQDKVVALVCDEELFVKITEPGSKFAGQRGEAKSPFPGAKKWMHISADYLEDTDFASELMRITADALPAVQLKPKKKS